MPKGNCQRLYNNLISSDLVMLKNVNDKIENKIHSIYFTIWPQNMALLSIISPPFLNPKPHGSLEKNTPA